MVGEEGRRPNPLGSYLYAQAKDYNALGGIIHRK
jgi:hypothetical protein